MHSVVFAFIAVLVGAHITDFKGDDYTNATEHTSSAIQAEANPNPEDSGEHKGHDVSQIIWGFSPTFTLGDIAETLALPVTIILAYFTLKRSARDQRELTMLREALGQLNLLITLANEVSQMVESNLRYPTSDHKVQQRNTEQLRKRLDCEILIAEAFLTESEAMALKLANKDWYDSTFCESWPRTKITGPLSPGDSQLAAISKGRSEWCKHIIQLKKKKVSHPSSCS